MQAADQAGFVGMKADRHQVDLELLGLEDDVGARDRKLADPALPKAAADHDALGVGPGLGLEEAPRHIGQFLGEFLDRAVHQRRGVDVVADQRLVELALADLVGGFVAERIVAVASSAACASASRILRNAPLLARSPRKPSSSFSSILKLSTSTDGRRVAPWPGDAGGRYGIFSHFAPARSESAGQRRREPIGFMGADGAWHGEQAASIRQNSAQILAFWPVFGPVFLDSGPSRGYKSRNPARDFSRAVCFCANSRDRSLQSRGN